MAPIQLPGAIPVMVLPGCALLPHNLLPLYIFEPRYRQMLADALAGERMFAIGTADPDTPADDAQPAVLPHSCAGLVRACVGNPDGTSNLVLQGLQRIEFVDWVESDKLYRIARIEPLVTDPGPPGIAAALAARALELARELVVVGHPSPSEKTMREFDSVDDPEALGDLVANHFLPDPYRRQALLGVSDLCERLRQLIRELGEAGPSFPA